MGNSDKLLEIKNLEKHFELKSSIFSRSKRILKAVDGVSLDINRGETLGLVGESGCGKTTVGRVITRLYEPTKGSIIFNGRDIAKLNEKDLTPYRKKMNMIFQDPYTSLNPRMTVSEIISEPMNAQGIKNVKEKKERVLELLNLVGLNKDFVSRFPHEFSGGQRQRVGIARSLASNPEFIVADEPTSALDVSVQAQVVNLLENLQNRLGITYLFIAHDLAVVQHISSRVGVMYLGKIVEITDPNELYKKPLHPYTQALISAIPIPDPKVEYERKRTILEGDIPNPMNKPSGCSFRTRCPIAKSLCAESIPQLREVSSGHFVACHLV